MNVLECTIYQVPIFFSAASCKVFINRSIFVLPTCACASCINWLATKLPWERGIAWQGEPTWAPNVAKKQTMQASAHPQELLFLRHLTCETHKHSQQLLARVWSKNDAQNRTGPSDRPRGCSDMPGRMFSWNTVIDDWNTFLQSSATLKALTDMAFTH